jgi:hypothetical protein
MHKLVNANCGLIQHSIPLAPVTSSKLRSPCFDVSSALERILHCRSWVCERASTGYVALQPVSTAEPTSTSKAQPYASIETIKPDSC